MKKKKLKAKIAKLEKALLDKRMGVVAHHIATAILTGQIGGAKIGFSVEEGGDGIIGSLRRAAEAGAKAKSAP